MQCQCHFFETQCICVICTAQIKPLHNIRYISLAHFSDQQVCFMSFSHDVKDIATSWS